MLKRIKDYLYPISPVPKNSRRAFRNMRELDEDEVKVNRTVLSKEPERTYEVQCKKGHVRHIRVLGEDSIAQGAIKKCWNATLHGGKDPDKIKQKVFLESVDPAEMQQVIDNNVFFSKQLRVTAAKQGREDLFMKYEAINQPGSETPTWLMAAMASGGTLEQQLENNPRALNSLQIIKDLLLAGSIMEACGYYHRDLKLSNIFMHEGRPVIGDFDTMTNDDLVEGVSGTSAYSPPDLVLHVIESNAPYSPKAAKQDSFAMGIILLELLMKKPAGDRFMETNLYGSDFSPTVNLSEIHRTIEKLEKQGDIPPKVIQILKDLLEFNPQHRLTLTQAHKILNS